MTKPTKSTKVKSKASPSTSSSTNYKVICTDNFLREAKALAKRYPNIKDDFLSLKDVLKKNPETGDDLGAGLYKIQMAISDKKRGKAESARVIVHVRVIDKEVYVLSTYDKGEFDTIIIEELKKRFKKDK